MKDFFKGVKDVSPMITGVVPFGLIYGATAVKHGLTTLHSIVMSQIIFAGASQIALISQMAVDASIFVCIATVVMVNLRMLMYSASISPYFRKENIFLKWFASYFLTDQAYGVAIVKYNEDKNINHIMYYLGAGITMWVTWQISTILGIFVGKTLPQRLFLEFAIPLTFLALLRPFLNKHYFVITALTSGMAMVFLKHLPFNAGFFIAVFLGVLSGVFFKRFRNEL